MRVVDRKIPFEIPGLDGRTRHFELNTTVLDRPGAYDIAGITGG